MDEQVDEGHRCWLALLQRFWLRLLDVGEVIELPNRSPAGEAPIRLIAATGSGVDLNRSHASESELRRKQIESW